MSILITNFCIYYTQMGDKRIAHNLNLIAISVGIWVSVSLALRLVDLFDH
jgi:hypothetical protein